MSLLSAARDAAFRIVATSRPESATSSCQPNNKVDKAGHGEITKVQTMETRPVHALDRYPARSQTQHQRHVRGRVDHTHTSHQETEPQNVIRRSDLRYISRTTNLDDSHADAFRGARLLHEGVHRVRLDTRRSVHLQYQETKSTPTYTETLQANIGVSYVHTKETRLPVFVHTRHPYCHITQQEYVPGSKQQAPQSNSTEVAKKQTKKRGDPLGAVGL